MQQTFPNQPVLTGTFGTFGPKPNSSQICSVQKTDYPGDKISDIAPLDLTVPGLYQRNRQKTEYLEHIAVQRGGCQCLQKKGSESLVISPLVPFATCKLD